MAFDLPVMTTRWRAVADTHSPEAGILVPPGDSGALANALRAVLAKLPRSGVARAVFIREYTEGRHLNRLAGELLRLAGSNT